VLALAAGPEPAGAKAARTAAAEPMVPAIAVAGLDGCRCDPALARIFTPVRPQHGRYAVCTTEAPPEAVAGPDPRVETQHPLDAFGTAGPYNRARLALLYGGRQARVARWWRMEGNQLASMTAISPYPNAALSILLPGTLVIVHTVPLP
jgi:hypothetical protein